MPTRYWLIGPDEVLRVSQLEAAGGVRRRGGDRCGAHRGRASPLRRRARHRCVPDEAAPAHGGVGGRRRPASYAWHLAGGDDPIGRWVADQLALPDEGRRARRTETSTAITTSTRERPARRGRQNCRGRRQPHDGRVRREAIPPRPPRLGQRQSALHRPQQGGPVSIDAAARLIREGELVAFRPRRSTAWAAMPPTSARWPPRPRDGRSSIR